MPPEEGEGPLPQRTIGKNLRHIKVFRQSLVTKTIGKTAPPRRHDGCGIRWLPPRDRSPLALLPWRRLQHVAQKQSRRSNSSPRASPPERQT